MSSLQQNCRKGQNRFCLEGRGVKRRGMGQGRKMTQTMYARMNKFLKRKKKMTLPNVFSCMPRFHHESIPTGGNKMTCMQTRYANSSFLIMPHLRSYLHALLVMIYLFILCYAINILLNFHKGLQIPLWVRA
jgi:hypothetical protein